MGPFPRMELLMSEQEIKQIRSILNKLFKTGRHENKTV